MPDNRLPSDRARRMIEIADGYVRDANNRKGVEETVYHGNKAVVILLGTLVAQMDELIAAVERNGR